MPCVLKLVVEVKKGMHPVKTNLVPTEPFFSISSLFPD